MRRNEPKTLPGTKRLKKIGMSLDFLRKKKLRDFVFRELIKRTELGKILLISVL